MLTINGVGVGNELYPNNEIITKSVIIKKEEPIAFKLSSSWSADILCLAIYANWAKDKFPESKRYLVMDYVPYSRMDREIDGYIFSLKYFCQIINSLNFDKVYILDPHSIVTPALLERCEIKSIQQNIDKVISLEKPDVIFYPDAGAMKRYSEELVIPDNIEIIYGNKQRDLKTGKIIGFSVVDGGSNLDEKTVLIIDDLCSFGGTFLESSKQLINLGAKRVSLYVTHCESSIYNGKLLKENFISKIYTTDSILDSWESNKIINILEEQ